MRKFLLLMLGILALSTHLLAQSRTISGRITDPQGNPVSNASVVVKGTTQGTTSDASGNFRITVPASAESLIISAIGFADQEISMRNRINFSIALASNQQAMNEVVVVAYGTQRRGATTGSIAQVNAKQLENRPITNALNALVGAAPGIQTSTPSGAPGSSPGIIVRGFGSFSLSSAPLYVVDGVIYDGGFSNLNPDDIETITVLKDASTTALYGAKGANGVVMITTKRAKKGKQNVQFKVQMGVSNPAIPEYPTVDAFQFYPLAWEAYRNGLVYGTGLTTPTTLDSAGLIASGLLPRYTSGANVGNQIFRGGSFQDIYQILGKYNPFNVGNTAIVLPNGQLNPNASLRYGDDLDWLDQSTRRGTRNEYGLQFSSATDKFDLFSSFSYLKEGGWGLRSDLSRFSARVNANARVTDWFRSGFNLAGNRTKFNNAATGGIVNAFYFSRYIAPIYPVYLHDPVTGGIVMDATGNPRYDFGNENGYGRPYNSGRHTIAEHLWNLDNDVRDVISARGFGEITFAPWLTLTTNISTDITNNENEGYENPIVGDGYPSGRYSRGTSRVTSYTFNQLLNFNKRFAAVHNVDVLLGHENYDYKTTGISGLRIGQAFENIYQFSNFGTINSLGSSYSASRSEGFFSRLNYDYNGKYLLSASFRRDGNSKFPTDLRWANFWSVGLGWSIEKESFLSTVSWINQLKLRASYGVTGNSNTGNYPYQAGYDIGWDDDTRPGIIVSSLGSPQLTWETQKPLDIGLDFGLFKNRLYGTLGYFYRNSSGLIFSVPQPLQNGGTPSGSFTVSQNIGEMVNKGMEAQISGVPVRSRNLNWTVTVNATHYTNELTKMPEATPALTSSPFKREVGKSIYEFYTRDFYGVDPQTGSALYKGVLNFNPANSQIISKNGGFDTVTIDHNNARQDYVNKTSLPDVYGSFTNSLSYKNFELGFVITYQIGGYVYDGVYAALMSTATNGGTYHTDILKRWQKPGDITDVPRLDNTRSAQFGATSDRFLTSATYFSINNVSLSYQLPKSFLSAIKATSARFFISGENLHFFTKRKGMNVNGNFSGQTSDSYDAARIINAGLSVNF
ncbi:MAG: SusC/RagA family TonB-linked outer membrane protein [Gammaproteobacteria bacterium]|nr:MAG: SusC/RagA family TonB-linked outer membrane protein [Gammaproteobacteria bacterium]